MIDNRNHAVLLGLKAIKDMLSLTNPTFAQFLDVVGDGTGDESGVGNFSITPRTLFLQPPPGKTYLLNSLIIYVQDTTTLDAGSYWNNITLDSGIELQTTINSNVIDVLDGRPIMTNASYARHGARVEFIGFGGGDDSYQAVINLKELAGSNFVLNGDNNDKIEIILNDDLSGLTEHTFKAFGFTLDNE